MYHSPIEKEKRWELLSHLSLCLSSFTSILLRIGKSVDICQTCVLEFYLVLNTIETNITTLVKAFMVRLIFPRQVHGFVQPVFTSVTFVVRVREGVPFFNGHYGDCFLYQFSFLGVFQREHPFLPTAIGRAFSGFVKPTRSKGLAVVNVNYFLVNEEQQVSLCAVQQMVVVQEGYKV